MKFCCKHFSVPSSYVGVHGTSIFCLQAFTNKTKVITYENIFIIIMTNVRKKPWTWIDTIWRSLATMADVEKNKNQAFKLKQICQTQQLPKWMATKAQVMINDFLQLLHKNHRLTSSSIAKTLCVILSSFNSLERSTSQACKAQCF